jgi:hypothetical protein
MTDNVNESSFIKAASLAIKDLQDEGTALRKEVASAKKAAKWRKFQVRLLGIGFALIVIGGVILGLVALQAHDTSSRTQATALQLKNDSIANCESNNTFRAGQKEIWTDFVGILLAGHPTRAQQNEGNAFLKYVDIEEAPKKCQELYSNVGVLSALQSPPAYLMDDATLWQLWRSPGNLEIALLVGEGIT